MVKDSWQNIPLCDVLLVRHDNDCSYNYQEKAYSHLLDTVGELCTRKKLKVGSVATPFSKLTLDKAFYSPVSFNVSLIFAEIKRKLMIVFKNEVLATEEYDKFRVNLWNKILARAKPKIVVGIQPDQYLCKAGKAKGIPVFDFQHGVISSEHLWYGKEYRLNKPIETLPDGFLCWDERAVETLSEWTRDKGIIILKVGNPWFARFSYPKKNDFLVQEAFTKVNSLFDERPCILVSLQWGLKELHPDRNIDGMLVPELRDVIKNNINDYNWILRLHPVQMRGDGKNKAIKYLSDNYGLENTEKWLIASELPLPAILTKTDLHITYYSTVVIESAWMGIKSGLLSEELSDGGKYQNYYLYERKMGLADILPHDSNQIKNWIAFNLKEGKKKPMLIDTSNVLNAFIDTINGR
jgi:hypothetical protein